MKNRNRASDMWDSIKWSHTAIIGISEGEEADKKIVKIVALNFLNCKASMLKLQNIAERNGKRFKQMKVYTVCMGWKMIMVTMSVFLKLNSRFNTVAIMIPADFII